ncbi:hypothetical protein PFISCL1PPCAC_4325, partial [Pristionchus fissidentatus]
ECYDDPEQSTRTERPAPHEADQLHHYACKHGSCCRQTDISFDLEKPYGVQTDISILREFINEYGFYKENSHIVCDHDGCNYCRDGACYYRKHQHRGIMGGTFMRNCYQGHCSECLNDVCEQSYDAKYLGPANGSQSKKCKDHRCTERINDICRHYD